MTKKRTKAAALIGSLGFMLLAAFSAPAAEPINPPGTFGSRNDANGYWSKRGDEGLEWTDWDGTVYAIGRGPKFSEVHPEITDAEYFLKQNINYPGDQLGNKPDGTPKASYDEVSIGLLQEFVGSFDWINADEYTRVRKVYDTIARGRNGNREGAGKGASFDVLQHKTGVCADYASDFQRLASYVGLECVYYSPSYLHAACLVKINGQWITVDPYMPNDFFDNTITMPVDFEAEYYRYGKEIRESEEYKRQMEQIDLQRKAEAGEITWMEYYRILNPDMTDEEIQQQFFSWDGYVEGLGN